MSRAVMNCGLVLQQNGQVKSWDVTLFYRGYDFVIVAEKSRQKGTMLTT
jgi:hypothetical protein